jgi:hypothetical protein
MKALKQTILNCLHKTTSQVPMAYIALMDAVFEARPQTTTDEFESALEKLCDAVQVRAIRGHRGGYWQNLYWPVAAPETPIHQLEEVAMSEPKNSLLNRLILLHGPIAGPALAEKARATGANIPAKNVPGLLETLVRKGEVIVRKHQFASHYMTPNQAADWDENVSAAGGERDNQAGAHVMSAAPETKQSDAENPVNETRPDQDDEAMPEPDAALMASANRMLHEKLGTLEQNLEKQSALLADKAERIVALEKQLNRAQAEHADVLDVCFQLCNSLKVSQYTELPGALFELERALSNRILQGNQSGRLALLNISDDGEQIDADLNYLEPYVDEAAAIRTAKQIADIGSTQRCIVMRVLGQAERSRAIWTPMVAPEVQTLRDAA